MAYFTHPQLKCGFKNFSKICKAFFLPKNETDLKNQLAFYFPKKQIVFTDMGRTGFRLILKSLNLQNSAMLFPAYICDIFLPILQEFNITPIFLDIDLNTFNISKNEIEAKISSSIRSILVCHTYGLAMDIEKIMQTAKKHNLLVIEDIAHSLGNKQNGKFLGNYGNACFSSLYKQFPALRGGMAVLPENRGQTSVSALVKTRFSLRDMLSLLNYFSFFSFVFKKFGSKVAPKYLRKEKNKQLGAVNRITLNLFSQFLPDLEKNIAKRQELAKIIQRNLQKLGFQCQTPENNVFTFLSVLVPENLSAKRDEFVKKLRKQNIFATRIWHTPIILNKDAQKAFRINPNQFPNTMKASRRIINIPLQNHFTEKHCQKIISAIEKTLTQI